MQGARPIPVSVTAVQCLLCKSVDVATLSQCNSECVYQLQGLPTLQQQHCPAATCDAMPGCARFPHHTRQQIRTLAHSPAVAIGTGTAAVHAARTAQRTALLSGQADSAGTTYSLTPTTTFFSGWFRGLGVVVTCSASACHATQAGVQPSAAQQWCHTLHCQLHRLRVPEAAGKAGGTPVCM